MIKCFEVENIGTRQNMSFRLDTKKNTLELFNTSRGAGNSLLVTFPVTKDTEVEEGLMIEGQGGFPFECKTAEEYFQKLYDKAIAGEDNVHFLGWADPETFEPIEPDIEPTILETCARILFIEAWDSERRELKLPVSPVSRKLEVECPPEVPDSFLQKARDLLDAFEKQNDMAWWEVLRRCAAADNVDNNHGQTLTSSSPDPHSRMSYVEAFGYHLAMSSLGHGVGWEDDHADFDIEWPNWSAGINSLEYSADDIRYMPNGELAERMLQWHGGAASGVYSVGSTLLGIVQSGKTNFSEVYQAKLDAAIWELELEAQREQEGLDEGKPAIRDWWIRIYDRHDELREAFHEEECTREEAEARAEASLNGRPRYEIVEDPGSNVIEVLREFRRRFCLEERWRVEESFSYGWDDAEWVEDGHPRFFLTQRDAEKAIDEFIKEQHAAFERGDMADKYERKDYRAVFVEPTNEEIHKLVEEALKAKGRPECYEGLSKHISEDVIPSAKSRGENPTLGFVRAACIKWASGLK